jgi:hypothetical protein
LAGSAHPVAGALDFWQEVHFLWQEGQIPGRKRPSCSRGLKYWAHKHQEMAHKHGEMANEQGEMTNEQGEMTNEQGEMTNEQGEMANEQGEMTNEQGEMTNDHQEMAHDHQTGLYHSHPDKQRDRCLPQRSIGLLGRITLSMPDQYKDCAEVIAMVIDTNNSKVRNRGKKADEEQAPI